MMKMAVLFPAFFGLCSIAAHAGTFAVTCKPASEKVIGRSDAIADLVYVLDTHSGTARLECDNRDPHGPCQSIRLDLSKFLGTSEVEKCGLEGQDSVRQVFSFLLTQEDELDNLVMLTVTKVCKGGKLEAAASAVISQGQSSDLPEDAVVVECSVR